MATNKSKKLKKSNPKDVENDGVMDQKAKDLGDLGDSMSEEEAKSDMVDLTSNDEPKGHIGESELVGEGGSKKYTSMPVLDEELKGGVVEIVYNLVKEEELVCESKPNVNEEMKVEPRVEKMNEDLVKDEKIEGVSIMFFFSFFSLNQILFLSVVYAIPSSLFPTVAFPIQIPLLQLHS